MLWDRFSQLREFISVLFCVLFSISSLVWNGNLVVRGVASTQRVSNAVSSSIDSFGSFFKSIYNKLESYESIRKERDSYAKLVEEYKVLPQDISTLRAENDLLRKELGFSPKVDYPYIKAEVLSVRLNSIYRTIIVNKGKDAGIRPYMPVIGRALDESNGQVIQALVGKVIAVTGGSSVIQPIINSNFTMGVQIPKTNFWATLSGNSGRSMEAVLNYIDNGIIVDPKLITGKQIGPSLPTNETSFIESFGNLGKTIYSSSGGGVFPANIPVGIIVEEGQRSGAFKTAYVKPYIKFEELQYVSIIKKIPDKWVEDWPEEKSISIENPYFGELNFPGEILENKDQTLPKEKKPAPSPLPNPAPNKVEAKTVTPPVPVVPKEKKKLSVETEEDEMLRKLEEPSP
ncbi:MAG: rod shape-determining protein MreC [Leptospiraceae bacterium]|nr:rod shape-determining protein MreC [Leptospiraceae bacterium]